MMMQKVKGQSVSYEFTVGVSYVLIIPYVKKHIFKNITKVSLNDCSNGQLPVMSNQLHFGENLFCSYQI